MRTVQSIKSSFQKWGYTHLRKDQHTLEEAQKLAAEAGGRIEATTNFHYTTVPSEAPAASGTDFEAVRRHQHERRQKLAASRKRKEQNT